MNGRAPRPASELMLTMRPRAALRRGRKACVTATAPTSFTSKTWRSWSRGTSSRGPADGMPALLTSAASGAPASARVTSSRARAMLAVSRHVHQHRHDARRLERGAVLLPPHGPEHPKAPRGEVARDRGADAARGSGHNDALIHEREYGSEDETAWGVGSGS